MELKQSKLNQIELSGCNSNIFTTCGTTTEAANCPALTNCSAPDKQVCPLTNTCHHSSTPCSCESSFSTPPSYCANTGYTDASYTLVAQVAYEIPANTAGPFTAKVGSGVWVRPHDILAFQSQLDDPGVCSVDASSQWKQVAFLRVGNNWTDMHREVGALLFRF
jgi:hypothetical protein